MRTGQIRSNVWMVGVLVRHIASPNLRERAKGHLRNSGNIPKRPQNLFLKHSLLQRLSTPHLDLLRPHHHERNTARLVSAVRPLVVDAALDDELARPHGLLLAAVQLEHDLARNDNPVIQAERAVHGRAELGRDVRHAEDHAARGTPRERARCGGPLLGVGHRDCRPRVENGECAAAGPKGLEGLDCLVRVEDRGAVFFVRGGDDAGVREGFCGWHI